MDFQSYEQTRADALPEKFKKNWSQKNKKTKAKLYSNYENNAKNLMEENMDENVSCF